MPVAEQLDLDIFSKDVSSEVQNRPLQSIDSKKAKRPRGRPSKRSKPLTYYEELYKKRDQNIVATEKYRLKKWKEKNDAKEKERIAEEEAYKEKKRIADEKEQEIRKKGLKELSDKLMKMKAERLAKQLQMTGNVVESHDGNRATTSYSKQISAHQRNEEINEGIVTFY